MRAGGSIEDYDDIYNYLTSPEFASGLGWADMPWVNKALLRLVWSKTGLDDDEMPDDFTGSLGGITLSLTQEERDDFYRSLGGGGHSWSRLFEE